MTRTIEKEGIRQYMALVDDVMNISKEAASYLLTKAPDIDGFVYSGNLLSAFGWDKSEQGGDYWKLVHEILRRDQNR